MRKLFVFLLVVLAVAQAQDVTLIDQLLDLTQWMENAQESFAGYNEAFTTLAYRFVILGLVLGGLYLVLNGGGIGSLVTRIFTAIFLLALATPINTLAVASWESIRAFSTGALQETFIAGQSEFRLFGENVYDLNSGTAALSPGSNEQARPDVAPSVALTLVSIITMSVITVVVMLLLAATGIAVTLAGLTIPLGAGLMAMNVQTGSLWISAYVRVVVGALFFVLVLPPVFDVAYDLAVVQVVRQMNTQMEEHVANLEAIRAQNEASIRAEIGNVEAAAAAINNSEAANNDERNAQAAPEDNSGGNWFSWLPSVDVAQALKDQFLQTLTNFKEQMTLGLRLFWADFTGMIRIFFFSLLLMILSIAAAIFMVFKVEQYCSALMGGVALGIANGVSNASSYLVGRAFGHARQHNSSLKSGLAAAGKGMRNFFAGRSASTSGGEVGPERGSAYQIPKASIALQSQNVKVPPKLNEAPRARALPAPKKG